MMLKKSLVALALGLGVVAQASADVINLGDVTFADTVNQFVSHSTGSFVDTINFSLSQMASGDGKAFAYDSLFNTKYNLKFTSAELYSKGSVTDTLVSPLFITPDAKQVLGGGVLAAGDYYFKLAGVASGTSGGIYGFGSVITPVPEPESYAMFLAGLGLIGAIARRRKLQAV